MERGWIERQRQHGSIKLMQKQLAARSDLWCKGSIERTLQLQHGVQQAIRDGEAGQHRKTEAGKRRMISRIERTRQEILTEEELEDINQYQVPMATDPNTVAESPSVLRFASKRRRE